MPSGARALPAQPDVALEPGQERLPRADRITEGLITRVDEEPHAREHQRAPRDDVEQPRLDPARHRCRAEILRPTQYVAEQPLLVAGRHRETEDAVDVARQQ